MTTQTETTQQAEIRQLIDDWTQAVMDKDIDSLMSFYSPQIVAYDMCPPMQFIGSESYRKSWQQGFDMCQQQGRFESHDMTIVADENIAFCHRLNHMTGQTNSGQDFDLWVRWTTGFQKTDGKWLITHEHISAPIDMETNKAVFDYTT